MFKKIYKNKFRKQDIFTKKKNKEEIFLTIKKVILTLLLFYDKLFTSGYSLVVEV
jgi:hypothetical protein